MALLLSGKGRNAKAILPYFSDHPKICISLLVSNVPEAGAFLLGRELPLLTLPKYGTWNRPEVLQTLHPQTLQSLVLAGFLHKIPKDLIPQFPGKILNLHPSLLPEFGGQGMYGMRLHRAVVQARTGISIHIVNEVYDAGQGLLQVQTMINECDSPESLVLKIRKLEHYWYPRCIDGCFSGKSADFQ